MKRITITLAAVALVVAGCGTSANETFKRDYNQAQQPLQQLLADVSTSTSDAKKLDQLATGLEDTSAKMKALDAPEDAKDEFAAFLKEVDASATAVRDLQGAGDKPEQLAQALTGLQQQMSRVVTAEEALKTAVDG